MNHGFQLFPEQASTFASRVDALYIFLLLVAVFFTGLILAAIVFLALYYRKGTIRDREPAKSNRSWLLETTWIVIPFALVMVIFAWGADIYFDEHVIPTDAI